MIIKGGKVLNGNFEFIDADILTDGQRIEEIGKIDGNCDIDASGMYVIPGFIDTHMHSSLGKNFVDYDDETYGVVAKFQAENGTTALVPALSAAPKQKLLDRIEYMVEASKRDDKGLAKVYGFHLEGPFFSEKYKGAHLPENIRDTDPEEFMEYVKAGGEAFKIITLAPELPNADEVIKLAVENNICVSLGHTNATYEQVRHAVDIGASQGTHLFNAMSALTHRAPGTVGGLLCSDARVEIIGDFFHVHGDVVKMVYDLKGKDKINIITDSEIGTGMPDGEYMVNGRKITVTDKKTYTEDGTIAGGTSVLLDCVRNLYSAGIPMEDICTMVSKNPAQTVGIYDKTGSLEEGKMADIVILDKDLELKHVVLRGELLF
ncbi:MAG: N-acetylglucosamine-6-phosphate deacetylase [Clostridia bacterium]|nr:N-acetylglucosamine-6-phosphate deacetylase [Clostridia bacterium]